MALASAGTVFLCLLMTSQELHQHCFLSVFSTYTLPHVAVLSLLQNVLGSSEPINASVMLLSAARRFPCASSHRVARERGTL